MVKSRKNIKVNDGVKLYNKILREFSKVNSRLPEDRQITIQERRKYVSENVYPQFKGKKSTEVKVSDIKEQVLITYSTLFPKGATNVNLISPSIYSDVMWFELDDFIRDVLPKGIFIRIDGDSAGSTRIFNTNTYDYNKSGVRKVLDKIREEVNNSSDASFTGVRKLRSGKKNDGKPENYFIDFVLVINSVPTKSITPVPFKLDKSQKKQATSVRNVILQRVKQLTNKRKRKKNARKTAKKNLKEAKKLVVRQRNAKSSDYKRRLAEEKIKQYNKSQRHLDSAYNKGNLTKEQYDKFTKELLRLIFEAKKEGGII